MTAIGDGREHHLVSRFHQGDARSHLRDNARAFMPEYDRQRERQDAVDHRIVAMAYAISDDFD